jgi:hypothetical protein
MATSACAEDDDKHQPTLLNLKTFQNHPMPHSAYPPHFDVKTPSQSHVQSELRMDNTRMNLVAGMQVNDREYSNKQ